MLKIKSIFNKIRTSARRFPRCRLAASYTVEAAFIVPLAVWVLALGMQSGMSMYSELKSDTEQENIDDLWVVDDFYTAQTAGDVWGELTNGKS